MSWKARSTSVTSSRPASGGLSGFPSPKRRALSRRTASRWMIPWRNRRARIMVEITIAAPPPTSVQTCRAEDARRSPIRRRSSPSSSPRSASMVARSSSSSRPPRSRSAAARPRAPEATSRPSSAAQRRKASARPASSSTRGPCRGLSATRARSSSTCAGTRRRAASYRPGPGAAESTRPRTPANPSTRLRCSPSTLTMTEVVVGVGPRQDGDEDHLDQQGDRDEGQALLEDGEMGRHDLVDPLKGPRRRPPPPAPRRGLRAGRPRCRLRPARRGLAPGPGSGW